MVATTPYTLTEILYVAVSTYFLAVYIVAITFSIAVQRGDALVVPTIIACAAIITAILVNATEVRIGALFFYNGAAAVIAIIQTTRLIAAVRNG